MNHKNDRFRSLANGLPERRSTRRAWLAAVGLAVSFLIPASAFAEARLLRWYHPEPATVDGFRVLWGTAAGDYPDQVDVGLPVATDGVYSYSVELLDAAETHVAIVAYNADGASAPSQNTVFTPSATDPGGEPTPVDPVPDPDPTPSEPTDGTALFPPVSGALLAADFSTPLSSDWLQTGANNSLVPTSGLFGIRSVAGTNALSTSNEGVNIHAHYVPAGASNWTNYEFRGRLYVSSSGGGIGVTLFSDYPRSDSYYRLRRKAAGGESFTLSAHPFESATLSCNSPSTGVVPDANAWYVFRLRAQSTSSSSIVEAKIWRQGTSEPANWQARCDDVGPGRLTGGSVGVWSMGTGLKAWDDLEVVPAGSNSTPRDEPPLPPVLIQVVPVQ